MFKRFLRYEAEWHDPKMDAPADDEARGNRNTKPANLHAVKLYPP